MVHVLSSFKACDSNWPSKLVPQIRAPANPGILKIDFVYKVDMFSMNYAPIWGARKIKESLYTKSEHADHQLMNRDAGLAISAIWQQAL